MKVLTEALLLTGCVVATARMYSRSNSYVGTDFFSGWTFWTAPDPSRGAVKYVDFAEAAVAGLVNATPTRVYIGVDVGLVAGGTNRRSVRIQSRATFNQGLFVATVDHAPTGCGLWPALWLYGQDGAHAWPAWGEYDIIEATHRANQVMTSLHTSADCDQSRFRGGAGVRWMAGPAGRAADNCDVAAGDQFENQGCSQRGPAGSAGSAFNAGGGGTYAAEWDPLAKHIRTWFWRRGAEPLDLLEHRPDPESWGLPYSYFSLDPAVCSARHFVNMRLVFDITFCGDLAGSTFKRDCPEVASQMTCPEYVRQHPEGLLDAYWSVRVLDVYRRSGAPGGQEPPFVVPDVPTVPSPAPPGVVPPGSRSPLPPWRQGHPHSASTALWGSRRTPAEILVLCLGLATPLGIVFAGYVRRKIQAAALAGGPRCPAFYEHCMQETVNLNGTMDRSGELALECLADGPPWGSEGAGSPYGERSFVVHDGFPHGERSFVVRDGSPHGERSFVVRDGSPHGERSFVVHDGSPHGERSFVVHDGSPHGAYSTLRPNLVVMARDDLSMSGRVVSL